MELMNPKISKADVDFDDYCKNKCHGPLTTRSFPPLKERLNIWCIDIGAVVANIQQILAHTAYRNNA